MKKYLAILSSIIIITSCDIEEAPFITGSNTYVNPDKKVFPLQFLHFGLENRFLEEKIKPLLISTVCLSLFMPPRKVLDWCVRGYSISAIQAKEQGLVTHISNQDNIENELSSSTFILVGNS